eukprot:6707517-Pyramimonas_sp.AAC.1
MSHCTRESEGAYPPEGAYAAVADVSGDEEDVGAVLGGTQPLAPGHGALHRVVRLLRGRTSDNQRRRLRAPTLNYGSKTKGVA